LFLLGEVLRYGIAETVFSWKSMLKSHGAPGGIRTPDTQIRSLRHNIHAC
jgi:hypothetical protein